MKTNTEFKNEALAALRGNWSPAVLVSVIVLAIGLAVSVPAIYSSISAQASLTQMGAALTPQDAMKILQRTNGFASLQMLLYFFLFYPLAIGYANAFKLLLLNGDDKLTNNTFRIAFSNYWHKVWGYFLMTLLVFLWSLLLVIPGIIKALSYAMTPFILEDHPELSAREAIHLSRTMMKGHKFDLFYLCLSFIGWFLLCLLTFCIGFIWLTPYVQTSLAAFYQEVKGEIGDDFDMQIRATANL